MSTSRVRTLSADARLLPEIALVLQTARVHSVFERVVNLEAGSGRLITLAFSGADDAPDTLVVDLPGWSGLGLEAGLPVCWADAVLQLGPALRVAVDGARPWRSVLPNFVAERTALARNLAVAKHYLSVHGQGVALGAVGASPAGEAGDVEAAIRGIFQRHADGLYQALAAGDQPVAEAHADGLLGLGPGLTPAGDDFLLGLLASLNIPGSPAHALRTLGAFIVGGGLQKTNLISLAALRHAAEGRVRASLLGLCGALMNDEKSALEGALARVLAIGASSGSDIATGILAGFDLHLALLPPLQGEGWGGDGATPATFPSPSRSLP